MQLFVMMMVAYATLCNIWAQPSNYSSAAILHGLNKLNTTGSVLYIAAHPDDENTRLISYLANGLNLRTAYLSLTRGDGGQNLIGAEQGVDLGIIRTHELLAARKIDGGEQYFTRAYDFGYSKSAEETFTKWNKDSVLRDVVFVIRHFKPDVIITRFATDGSGGHGHHTASAILAEEAFDAAADPNRFPEQLQYVGVWQTRRLFWNVSTRFQNPNADMTPYLKMDVGGYNPLLGKSYGEIAAESRSMHRSQGFGSALHRGEYFEYFKPIKGDTTALKAIFDRMDFSWNRHKGGKQIESAINQIINRFDPSRPDLSVKSLHSLASHIKQMPYHYQLCNELIDKCNGYFSEYIAKDHRYAEGSTIKAEHIHIYRTRSKSGLPTKNDTAWKAQHPTPHFWLAKPIKDNFFSYDFYKHVADENHAPIRINQHNLMHKYVDPSRGELYRQVVIVPPVLIEMNNSVIVCKPGHKRSINIRLRATSDSNICNLMVRVPYGWKLAHGDNGLSNKSVATISGISLPFKGATSEMTFWIEATDSALAGEFACEVEVNGKKYSYGLKEIKYDHVPEQSVFKEASTRLIKLDVSTQKKLIGYIPGAGDDVAACIAQMGYEVVMLNNEKLAMEHLQKYETIIVGVRAYNVNDMLEKYHPKLMDYVANGGTLIVQYNTNSWAGPLKSSIGPYPFKITRNRITVEDAPVKFNNAEHLVLNSPNRITQSDFDGWIQERSIYHAGDWDKSYETILSMNDPGEEPDSGSLLYARHGKGVYIYTGIVFFRQLPAGVEGAYKLFCNLIEQN